MKKMHAVSSFGEYETRYSIQKFRLNSRENSKDDYLVLKVKTKSRSPSLDSPLTPPPSDSKPFVYKPSDLNDKQSQENLLNSQHEQNGQSECPMANEQCEDSEEASLSTNSQSAGHVAVYSTYHSITNGSVFERDSPAFNEVRRASEPEQNGSNPNSAVLLRKAGMTNKSHSMPTRVSL